MRRNIARGCRTAHASTNTQWRPAENETPIDGSSICRALNLLLVSKSLVNRLDMALRGCQRAPGQRHKSRFRRKRPQSDDAGNGR